MLHGTKPGDPAEHQCAQKQIAVHGVHAVNAAGDVACGKKAGVFAVTDEGFAKAILGMTDVVKREKEEHAL